MVDSADGGLRCICQFRITREEQRLMVNRERRTGKTRSELIRAAGVDRLFEEERRAIADGDFRVGE